MVLAGLGAGVGICGLWDSWFNLDDVFFSPGSARGAARRDVGTRSFQSGAFSLGVRLAIRPVGGIRDLLRGCRRPACHLPSRFSTVAFCVHSRAFPSAPHHRPGRSPRLGRYPGRTPAAPLASLAGRRRTPRQRRFLHQLRFSRGRPTRRRPHNIRRPGRQRSRIFDHRSHRPLGHLFRDPHRFARPRAFRSPRPGLGQYHRHRPQSKSRHPLAAPSDRFRGSTVVNHSDPAAPRKKFTAATPTNASSTS